MRSQHCGYWCPGAKAPGHQYPSLLVDGITRDHFVYVPSQWEMMLQCNVLSHWLGPYTKWFLYNHNKTKHNKDVCLFCWTGPIFVGPQCIPTPVTPETSQIVGYQDTWITKIHLNLCRYHGNTEVGITLGIQEDCYVMTKGSLDLKKYSASGDLEVEIMRLKSHEKRGPISE